jgi:nucleoside-diphosphate-sugar epimerase
VPGQYRNVIPNFIYWAMLGKPLPLTGNREMSRDFVFVTDIVEGLIKCSQNNSVIGEAVNLATGKEIFIYDIAESVNRKLSNKAGVNIINKRNWDTREKIIGDTTKAESILNFRSSVGFEHGLDLTIDWFLKNRENIFRSAEFYSGLNPALDVK